MASDKENMMSSANYYAGMVASAKTACAEAKTCLASVQSTVQGNWVGDSGDAMTEALAKVATEINTIVQGLETLEGKMRSRARSIYNNWPEEDISGT